MKTIPTSLRTRPISSGAIWIFTPKASRTSALPLLDVKDRFPCFAMRAPIPAATSAAAVEILKVVRVPPPVPQVSVRSSGSSAGTEIMTCRRALPPRHLAGKYPPGSETHEEGAHLYRGGIPGDDTEKGVLRLVGGESLALGYLFDKGPEIHLRAPFLLAHFLFSPMEPVRAPSFTQTLAGTG